MKLVPKNDFVLVEEVKAEHKQTSVIVAPESANRPDFLVRARVVEGCPATSVREEVKAGTIVYFSRAARGAPQMELGYMPVKFDGKEYLLVSSFDIAAVEEA